MIGEFSAVERKPPAEPSLQKPRRDDHRKIHAQPLPLTIFPVPPLVPHNPFSIAHIIFAYCIPFFAQKWSHSRRNYIGHLSIETRSVHVTDERAIRVLWEDGFWGKGSLSRSEPSWLNREKRRRGLVEQDTSEEVTRKRRVERRDMKRERAKKELEAIERTKQLENGGAPSTFRESRSDEDNLPKDGLMAANGSTMSASRSVITDLYNLKIAPPEDKFRKSPSRTLESLGSEEHLQLTPSEALFLASALGVLTIVHPDTREPLSLTDLILLFMRLSTLKPTYDLQSATGHPDNPFLVSYAAYHHYRSLGWVVRSGIKFGVDLLLYNKGPVFSHAEFAVIIVPSYSHSHWKHRGKEKPMPWHSLHMVNRVQSQVRKTLVLCYVDVPPPLDELDLPEMPLASWLCRYKVRDVLIRRWLPNRSRD